MKSPEVVTTYNLLGSNSSPTDVPFSYWSKIVSGDPNYDSLKELAKVLKKEDHPGLSYKYFVIERVDKTREVLEL